MTLPTTKELNTAFNFIKNQYYPAKDEVFFFDLSISSYTPVLFRSGAELDECDVVGKAICDKRPYIVIGYLDGDRYPSLTFHGVSFIFELDLSTNQTVLFEEIPPVLEVHLIKEQYAKLKQMLSISKAS